MFPNVVAGFLNFGSSFGFPFLFWMSLHVQNASESGP